MDDSRIAFGTFTSHYAYYDLESSKWVCANHVWSQSINNLYQHKGDTFRVGDAGVVYKNNEVVTGVGSLCNFIVAQDERLYFGGQEGIIWVHDLVTKETWVLYRNEAPVNCGQVYDQDELLIGDYVIIYFLCR
jgi:hypothetical protein